MVTENSTSTSESKSLKAFKIKRARAKGACTRCENYITSVDTNDVDLTELLERKKKFEECWDKFDDAQTQIEILEDSVSTDERENFEDHYFRVISAFERVHVSITNAQVVAPAIVPTLDDSGGREGQSRIRVKLPSINLPEFSGSYEEWLSFYETFQSLITNDAGLAKIQKFHYLKSCLKGEAAELIESLEVVENNYEEAWGMLKDRYDNKRIIIKKHIEAIFEIPSMNKQNCTALRLIITCILKHLRALRTLNCPIEHWDHLITHIIAIKLDSTTNKEWEDSLMNTSNDAPTLKEMIDFLTHRCQALEAAAKKPQMGNVSGPTKHNKVATMHLATNKNTCPLCKQNHLIYQCSNFLKLSVEDRISKIMSLHLCLNCLRTTSHRAKACKYGTCRKCKKRHSTLLHKSNAQMQDGSVESNENNTGADIQEISSVSHCSQMPTSPQVLLSTAIIYVYDSNDKMHKCRALLDNGSQPNFITSKLAKKLQLNMRNVQMSVGVLNQSTANVNNVTGVHIKSRFNNFKVRLECLVVNTISQRLPLVSFSPASIDIPPNIRLADPNFHKSSEIDLLIGAELFWQLLCVGQIRAAKNQPCLQKTQLGWIVSGKINTYNTPTERFVCNLSIMDQLHEDLCKFWEVEQVETKGHIYTNEEIACEEHYEKTFQRNHEGRFIVQLPIKKEKLKQLGESREIALRRFYSLERKLNKQPELKTQYASFIKEYKDLGHMKLVKEHEDSSNTLPRYYLPHHAVIKSTSLTTKLRVVFDASCKTNTNVSLNDALMVGPTLQDDLFSILLRFRNLRFVFTADISKMYRQVLVDSSQTSLQRILWRDQSENPIDTFELTTVTYGTAPASFLAIKSLHQLAVLEAKRYPVCSKIVQRDFYVDDLLTGANTKSETLIIRDELISLLAQGGFELRKWASNSPDLLEGLPNHTSEHMILRLNEGDIVRALGIEWDAINDVLQYNVPSDELIPKSATKRSILSAVAKIFDPLGLLGPVILAAKILIQRLWLLKLDWDESLPADIQSSWFQLQEEMQHLQQIRVSRSTVTLNDTVRIQIHGFSDASLDGYGACIYLRTTDADQIHTVTLLCSKSRVAPLKNLSLPKLELCGAFLLTQLTQKVINALQVHIHDTFFWTDSTIVLGWIRAPSRRWSTFVANRVGEIQQSTSIASWKHVPTSQNPADLVSRGATPQTLIHSDLWWKGPKWLSSQESDWPDRFQIPCAEDLPEQRKKIVVAHITTNGNSILDTLERVSSFDKFIRIIAYCLRFRHNTRQSSSTRSTDNFNVQEINLATESVLKLVQEAAFKIEWEALKAHKEISRQSKLLGLNPFLDDKGLIRVGGRLRNSSLAYSAKHQIILPANHRLTMLLIEQEHIRQLHAGPQCTLSSIRSRYWPLSARNATRKIIKRCVKCFKASPVSAQPRMGDLPAHRLKASRPFSTSGVDYCGPFYIRDGKRRNSKLIKCYGVIFVCFTIKAIHVELVLDMTTEAFLNALKRFIARRGKPVEMFSDNAKTFVGANSELEELRNLFNSEQHQRKILNFCVRDKIDWHFIPPRSPNFGGLWEAAVKATKYHLKRIAGEASLNYDEMYTLLTQIESVLNSRPISAISNDPNDLSFLTPGHFLIGDSLTSFPEPDLTNFKLPTLSRWQRIEQLRQQFWRRWSKEYLHQYQQRTKWKANSDQILKAGDLVILKEDNIPPLQWKMGRIEMLHPGNDNITRVATIKTAHGSFKRAISKLCKIPLDN